MRNKNSYLITGGTGSFGKAFVHNLVNSNKKISRLVIFSRDELKQYEMAQLFPIKKYPFIRFFLGDVRDAKRVVTATEDIETIIHAAALKQVPTTEYNPFEAIKTNIIGANNVISSVIEHGVKKAIFLSTDKAVYPINAMGVSKAMMERVVVAKSRSETGTMIACTRYGNVMASRGSVIPLFIKQIKNRKPITITDPQMTRFMMSLDQAVDLVLFAFEHGESGDIFVQKAPAATIQTLAKSITKILGKPSHEIKTIGTRHGEKLYETLLTKEEMVKAIDMDDYYRIPTDNRDLNYNKFFEEGEEIITQAGEYHSHNTHRLDEDELTNLLLGLREIQDDLEGFGTCK